MRTTLSSSHIVAGSILIAASVAVSYVRNRVNESRDILIIGLELISGACALVGFLMIFSGFVDLEALRLI